MTISVWVRQPDGKLVEEDVRVVDGNWWLVSDRVLNPTPPTP